ncbi:MAG: methionine--tRNA ligase subunit beta, partial [Butyricicoccus sp.]
NLVNRTIAMSHKYFDGQIMEPNTAEPVDEELKAVALALPGKVEEKMAGLHVADAIDEIFTLLRRSNKYIDETMPWALAKDESKKARLGTVLYNLLESIRFAAAMLKPYLPETADRIFAQLNVENKGVESLASFGGMPVGGKVGEAEILFSRIDIPKKLAEITGVDPEAEKKAAKEAKEAEKAAKKAEKAAKKEKKKVEIPEGCISIDEFAKVDMTVCKVLACENVEKSEKLLKFQLDDGSGTPRQILSGIAKFYKAEELVGKTVVACTNLPPRKMMGQESNGMIISAVRELEGGEEELHLLMLDDAVPAGSKLC